MNRLLRLLLRFRENQVVVVGDIEAMYHQVLVSFHNRDDLRLLWWSDADVRQPPDI